MAGEIAYKLTAEEKQAVEAIRRVAEAFSGVEGGIKKVSAETKALQQAEEELGRKGGPLWDAQTAATEKYQRQMGQLSQLYRAQKIDTEQLWSAQDKATKQYQAALKECEAELKRAGKAQEGAFGPAAVGHVKDLVHEIAQIGTIAGVITKTMEEMSAARKESAREAREAERGEGALAEVAGGDKQKYAELLKLSRDTAAKAGISRDEAARLTFTLASAGSLGDAEIFTQLRGQGIVEDPAGLARASKTLQTAFGGGIGDSRAMLSKAFAAGEYAPGYASQLLPAAAQAGVSAKRAGLTDVEVLAATAITSKALGGPEAGGTAIKALSRSLSRMQNAPEAEVDEEGHAISQTAEQKATRSRLRHALKAGSQTLEGQLDVIAGLKLNEGELQKLFGRQEGLQAFHLLQDNRQTYREAVGRIGRAPGEDLVGKILALPETDKNLAAAKEVRLQKGAESQSAEDLGDVTNLAEAVKSHYAAAVRQGKISTWLPKETDIALTKTFDSISSWIPGHGSRLLKTALDSGVLKDDPRLMRSVVDALGGEEEAFGRNPEGINRRQEYREEILPQLKEAAAALQSAARDMKSAAADQRNRNPSLSPKGDR